MPISGFRALRRKEVPLATARGVGLATWVCPGGGSGKANILMRSPGSGRVSLEDTYSFCFACLP